MKKVQNYLTKPEELRKKLQCPSFRHDFVQWSKSQLCAPQNRHSRSKSPNEVSKKTLNPSIPKNTHSRSKQNLAPNSLSKNNSLSKKIINTSSTSIKGFAQPRLKLEKNGKRKGQSQSQAHLHSFNHMSHNKSVDQSLAERSRSNYSSLHKNKQDSVLKSKDKKKKLQEASSFLKKQTPTEKKICYKYSFRTRQGCIASNPNKTNQDRLLIKTKIGKQDKSLFAVADGHGTYGHLVSQSIVQNFGVLAETQLASKNAEESLSAIYDELQKILNQSGSTLVSVVIEDNNIICANVGDSRAILARQVQRKSWEMIYLSQDQKPCVESQKRRILKCGGRVHALKDEKGQSIGPLRVWLPNQSTHPTIVDVQGLAMSRSLGDNVSKPYGVIHRPQLIKIPIDRRDKFILIASDGVWQFISNQQVLQLIVPFYRENKLQQACDALLKLAYERWTVEDTSVVDDITFVLVYLEQ